MKIRAIIDNSFETNRVSVKTEEKGQILENMTQINK